jgi:hypothetical protein
VTGTELIDSLRGERGAFLTEVHALGDRASRTPEGGGWSAVQVAQHLMLAETAFLEAVESGRPVRRRPIRDALGSAAVKAAFRVGLRVRIPTPRVDPDPPLPLPEVERRWRDVAERLDRTLRERARRAPREPVIRHPIAGPFAPDAAARFLRSHIRHHRRQLRRLEGRV